MKSVYSVFKRKEYWIDIVGYEGIYQLSSRGRIRNIDYLKLEEDGQLREVKGKEITPFIDLDRGVKKPAITFYKGSKKFTYFIEKLVADHFLPNPNRLKKIIHLDNDMFNNDVVNLKWSE